METQTGNQKGKDTAPPEQEQEIKQTKGLKAEITRKLAAIEKLKGERKRINSEVSSLLDSLESKGLNKQAVKAAMGYYALTEEQRANWDLTFAIVRDAQGCPMQQLDMLTKPQTH